MRLTFRNPRNSCKEHVNVLLVFFGRSLDTPFYAANQLPEAHAVFSFRSAA